MTPGPTLDQLIATVRSDAGSDDPLEQLATASRTVSEIEEVADAALSHFVDQCRRTGRSWSDISKALGVTKQAAHKRFSLTTPPTFERFTPRARAVLQGARAEARGLGHPYVGTEHLLLALFGDPDSIAAKVLSDLSMTRAQVEDDVVGITPRGSSTNDQPPFTPRAARCLEQTLNEALALGHNYIGTEHMLLGLLTDTEGFGARILIQRGATYEDARERVIGKLANFVQVKKS